MTKVNRGAITKEKELVYNVDTAFHGYKFRYPLAGVSSCHYEARVYKQGKYDHAYFYIDVTLSLFDSNDNTIFDDHYVIEEEDDLLTEEDGEGVGYIFPGSSIDLDEAALLIIQSAIPTCPVKEESEFFKKDEGADKEPSSKEEHREPSPWDVLEEIIEDK